jgi:hypothetical protein
MKTLAEYSDEEIETEAKRRAELKRQLPKMIANPDFGPLASYVALSMQHISEGRGEPKDFEHYVVEAVMTALYGRSIWKWWNAFLGD